MSWQQPRSTLTDKLVPNPTLFLAPRPAASRRTHPATDEVAAFWISQSPGDKASRSSRCAAVAGLTRKIAACVSGNASGTASKCAADTQRHSAPLPRERRKNHVRSEERGVGKEEASTV